MKNIESKAKTIANDDRRVIIMLARQLVYNDLVNLEEHNEGIFAHAEIIKDKLSETRELSKIAHTAILKNEIESGNLFVVGMDEK